MYSVHTKCIKYAFRKYKLCISTIKEKALMNGRSIHKLSKTKRV